MSGEKLPNIGRLHGQRAIITGAASGIGRATAELFAAEGARVLAVDLPGSEREWCREGITSFEADVSAEGTPRRIARALEEQFGGVDIIFNNAGVYRGMPLGDMTDAVWDEVFATTLRAGFRLCRELIPMLREAPAARIISTSSTSALVTIGGQAAYASAKAGLIALVRAMALELGPEGITSNAILPGPVLTKMFREVTDDEHIAALSARAPLGRIGTPEDIARVALFFASKDSAYVTGQTLVVDGGLYLGR